jgi:hypothetical protein
VKKSKTAAVSAEAAQIASAVPENFPVQHWLIKSEPHKFSITDLQNKPNSTGCWDGVRNYQVTNTPPLLYVISYDRLEI